MARSRENKANKTSDNPKRLSDDRATPMDSGGPVSEPQSPANTAALPADWCKQTLFQGWISIAVWMTFGLLLEGLLGYKTPVYLLDDERRELFRLAHTHGTLLGLLLIAAALCGQRFSLDKLRVALHALRAGSVLMPLGFLLAGIWHYESDPGLAIWLVPPAALLLIFGVVAIAIASRTAS